MPLYYNGELQTLKDDDLKRIMSSTIISGLEITINADTSKFDISAGVFEICDSYTDPENPTVTTVNYAGSTANTVTNLATQSTTYISMDVNGTIYQGSSTPREEELRDRVSIGVLIHADNVAITNALALIVVTNNGLAATVADFAQSIGIINVYGNVYSPNGANLNLNRSIGSSFGININHPNNAKNPNIIHNSALTALTFTYEWRDGAGGVQNYISNTIQPAYYDDNTTGSTTHPNGTVSSNKWTIMPIRYYPASGFTVINAGQTLYNSEAEAEAGIIDAVEDISYDNDSLRGWLIVRGAATDLSDPNDAIFIEADKFASSAAGVGTGVSTTTLQQAYDNSVTPEIVTDATRGALSVKRGTAADTDVVFEILDGADAGKVVATGDGKVGIGIDTPTTDLHVSKANAVVTSKVESTAVNGEAVLQLSNDARSWEAKVDSADNYVISDNDSTDVFQIDNVTGDVKVLYGDFVVDTDTLFVDSIGNNVGIGTTNPVYTLDVAGDMNLTGGVARINGTEVLSSTTLGTGVVNSSLTSVGILSGLEVAGDLTVDTNTLYVDSATNNVGIRTLTPSQALEVSGTGLFKFNGSLNGVIVENEKLDDYNVVRLKGDVQDWIFGTGNSNETVLDIANKFCLLNATTYTPALTIEPTNNNVGIATTDPMYTLDVAGDMNLTGGVARINGTEVLSSATLGAGVVNSSLTSVGALNSGSITSGFGSINTGADDITTTGTVSATTLAGTLSTAAQTNITSVGALDGGSITSGFGSIDTGADDITTTGTVSATTLAGTLSTAAQTNVTSLGTLSSLNVAGNLTVDTNTLFVNATTNRVGVGTLTPAESFEVVGGNLAINNGYNIHFNGNDTNWRLGYTSATPPSVGGFNAAVVQRIYGTDANYGYVIADDSDTVIFELEGNDGRSYFSGNMGIGVTNPSKKLEVNGQLKVSGDTWFNLAAGEVLGVGTDGSVFAGSTRLVIRDTDVTTGVTSTNTQSLRIVQDGGVNTLAATQFAWGNPTDAQVTAVFGALQTSITSNGTSDFVWGTHTTTAATDVSEKMRLTSDGNLGIANTAPSEKLEVTGAIKFSDALLYGVASSSTNSIIHVRTGDSTVPAVSTLGRPLLIEDDTNCRLGLAVSNSLTTNDAGLFVSQPADAGANNIKWDNFTAAATSGKLTFTVGNAAPVDMTSTAVNLNKDTTVTGDLVVNAATSTGGVISNFNVASIFYGHKSYNSNASGRTCVQISSPNTSNASGGAYVGYNAGGAIWVAGARPSGYYSINSSNDMIDAAVRMAIYNNGHVVLGETTPTDDGTNMLQVTGSTSISSNLTVDTNTLFVDATNNRVGIGTISPRSLLDVESATGGVLTISTSDTTVVANDTIGKINFYSSDASAGSSGIVANIEAVAATGDATDLHLRAGYSTGAGDPTLTDAVVIKSAGNVGIGTTTPSVFADLTLESGALCMKETTTPTADTNYGKIYTKSDNKLYFQDGAGTEHEIAFV